MLVWIQDKLEVDKSGGVKLEGSSEKVSVFVFVLAVLRLTWLRGFERFAN